MQNKRGFHYSKKAQLLSQPFTYIFAIVVIAMIVSFGFYMITRTTKVAESVDVLKFQKDFERKVNEISFLSPGSGDDVNMAFPIGVRGICFVDMKTVDASEIQFEDVKKSIEVYKEAEKTDMNVFFANVIGKKEEIKPLTILKLKPSKNPLCTSGTTGRLKVGLENKGKYVEISI